MAALEGLSLTEQIRRFWRWWTGELLACIPAGIRNWSRRLRVLPLVVAEGGGFSIYRYDGKTWKRIATAQGDTAESRVKALAVQLRGARIEKFAVGLPPGHFLAKTLPIPQAAEENLRNAIQYELDRHTPFKPEDVGFDCAIIGRNEATREILVRLVIAQKTTIANAVAAVAATGLTVAAVQPAAPDRDSLPINLLPHDEAANRMVQRVMRWLPWVVLVVLGALAIALPIFQKRAQVIELQPQVNVAAQQAAAADALHQQLDRAQNEYNFLLVKRYALPTGLQLLNEVTHILPDDTWLQSFELRTTAKGRELQLQGETGVAGKMIELFEQSPFVSGASFKSPVTQAPGSVASRFHIGMDVKDIAPPAGRVIKADAAAPGVPPGSPVPPGVTAVPGATGATIVLVPVAPPAAATAAPAPAPVSNRPAGGSPPPSAPPPASSSSPAPGSSHPASGPAAPPVSPPAPTKPGPAGASPR